MNSIVLIGPPGSGKSTVGSRLSDHLLLPWLDTDLEIEKRAGKSISEIFIDDGEERFRSLEAEIVHEVLQGNSTIISLGGGSVMNEETRLLIQDGTNLVIYLEVGIAAAAPRIGFNRDRPLLLVNPRQQWLSLFEKRRPVYESLADLKINNDGDSPDAAVEMIQSAWKERHGKD